MSIQFEVGKTYKYTDGREAVTDRIDFTRIDKHFTCVEVGEDGACWTHDVTFCEAPASANPVRGVWCVATHELLEEGIVVEVV